MFGIENYEFSQGAAGLPIDKNDVEIGTKIDNFLIETVEDIDNGVY